MKILVVNGVNLGLTGARELYGNESLASINARLKDFIAHRGCEADFFQSDSEGEIVARLHRADYDGLIINAGAFSHYSYAIADALACVKAKKIEVHITNIASREPFRHTSVLTPVCDGVIAGLGVDSYFVAAEYLTW